jgi:hypothetical protein
MQTALGGLRLSQRALSLPGYRREENRDAKSLTTTTT